MSCLNNDRSTMNEIAQRFDEELTQNGFDTLLQNAFDSGLNLDEILFVLGAHTNRTVNRYVVQDQLKRAANKDKNI